MGSIYDWKIVRIPPQTKKELARGIVTNLGSYCFIENPDLVCQILEKKFNKSELYMLYAIFESNSL